MLKIISKIGHFEVRDLVLKEENSFELNEWKESPELVEFIKNQWARVIQFNRVKSFNERSVDFYMSIQGENASKFSHALSNLKANPNKRPCETCGKVLTAADNFEYDICVSCIDNLEDKTGHCSMSCRMGNGCDESC